MRRSVGNGNAGSMGKFTPGPDNEIAEGEEVNQESGAQDLTDAVMRITKGAGVDVVYDSIGKATFDQTMDCLGPRGYFVSFDALPGLATEIVGLAADAGVKLTPAGATFPYRRDPNDANIRLAPTFSELDELDQAMQVFVVCVQLASIRSRLVRT